jgi:hypothetical protein
MFRCDDCFPDLAVPVLAPADVVSTLDLAPECQRRARLGRYGAPDAPTIVQAIYS